MANVFIGVDPHKLSATIEVVDGHEKLLGSGRFSTDQSGYTAMRSRSATSVSTPQGWRTTDPSERQARPRSKRCAASSAGSPTPCTDNSSPTPNARNSSARPNCSARVREGTAGRLTNPARPTCPRTSTLRISHFPDPQNRRYNRLGPLGSPPAPSPCQPPLDNKGEPKGPRTGRLVTSSAGQSLMG